MMQAGSGAGMDVGSAIKEQYALVPEADKGAIREDLVKNGFFV
jgi:hypothetical protein